MAELETRKRQLETSIEQGAPAPVRLRPHMGERYRKQVTGLIDALNEPDRRTEAAELSTTLSLHRRRAARNGLPSISMAIWAEFSAWFPKLAEIRQ